MIAFIFSTYLADEPEFVCLAYITQENAKSFASVPVMSAQSSYVFLMSERAKWLKRAMYKMWLYLKNKTTLFSHLCLAGPALGQHWEPIFGNSPRFSFWASPHRCLPPSRCPPDTWNFSTPPPPCIHNVSLFHITSAFYNVSDCAPSPHGSARLWRNNEH